MDEPSAILDDHEIETLFGVVRRLTEQGVGVIYISHRLDEVRRIGDRVTVLSDGHGGGGLPPDTPTDKLVEHMVGRKVERQLYPERQKRSGDVLLEVRGVGREPEIKPASFEVHAGEIVGIGGLVGAGRTELLRLIYGLDARDDGEVVVDGKRLPGAAGRGDRRRARARARGPQVARAAAGMVAGQQRHAGRPGQVPAPRAAEPASRAQGGGRAAAELNTKPDNPRALARELSGGNQQKVVLARWLMRQCKVMLFDEPTRGVDVGAKAEIYRLITDLSKAGKGLLVVSSELPELIGLCTRILVMREGEIVADVPGEEATEFELLRHAVIHPESVPEEIK